MRKINLGKKTSILANDVTLAKAQIGEGRQLSSDQAQPFKHNKTNQISMGEFQTTNKNKKMHVLEFQLSTSF